MESANAKREFVTNSVC